MLDLLCATVRGEAVSWPVEWDRAEEARLVALAFHHGLQPLLAYQVRRGATGRDWPAGVRAALDAAARGHALVEQLRYAELRRVLAALADAGVHPLLLKGTPLAYTHYRYPCLRPRRDTDLLVREADKDSMTRPMERLGYSRPNSVSGELVTHQVMYLREDRRGVRHAFDIHWKVSNAHLFAGLFSFDELAHRALRVPSLGEHALTLRPSDALLLACVHRVAHHAGLGDLIWLYDIRLLVERLDSEELNQFAALAAQKRVIAICVAGLELARRWAGARVPAGLMEQLAMAERTNGAEPSAVYLRRECRPLQILLWDLKAIRGWGRRLQLLREHAFPGPSYMLQAYGTTRRVFLPALYTHRLLRGARGFCRRPEPGGAAQR